MTEYKERLVTLGRGRGVLAYSQFIQQEQKSSSVGRRGATGQSGHVPGFPQFKITLEGDESSVQSPTTGETGAVQEQPAGGNNVQGFPPHAQRNLQVLSQLIAQAQSGPSGNGKAQRNSLSNSLPPNEDCNVCNRPRSVLTCLECGFTLVGRARKLCTRHPQVIHLMDLTACPKCHCHKFRSTPVQ